MKKYEDQLNDQVNYINDLVQSFNNFKKDQLLTITQFQQKIYTEIPTAIQAIQIKMNKNFEKTDMIHNIVQSLALEFHEDKEIATQIQSEQKQIEKDIKTQQEYLNTLKHTDQPNLQMNNVDYEAQVSHLTLTKDVNENFQLISRQFDDFQSKINRVEMMLNLHHEEMRSLGERFNSLSSGNLSWIQRQLNEIEKLIGKVSLHKDELEAGLFRFAIPLNEGKMHIPPPESPDQTGIGKLQKENDESDSFENIDDEHSPSNEDQRLGFNKNESSEELFNLKDYTFIDDQNLEANDQNANNDSQ